MIDRSSRLDYVDGLRGVAIGLVVLTHAWLQSPPLPWNPSWSHNKMNPGPGASPLDFLANRGYQGVSLFLVLSGFCLAYPALSRRAEGDTGWFIPSRFFARRIVRILPPYYAALLLSIAAVALFRTRSWPVLPSMGSTNLEPANVLSHILLLQNLLPYAYMINSPFWSLGLEWQWYWIFPVVLVMAARFPGRTAAVCLMLSVLWQARMENMPIVVAWLPGRVFEFCCGVLVARLVVRGCRPRAILIGAGAVAAVVIAELPAGTIVGDSGLYQPLYGLAFSLLLLLASTFPPVRSLFGWRPLARLGTVSYSVYLVHRPVSDAIEAFGPLWLRSSWLVIPCAAAAGITIGWLFYRIVERPCVDGRVWSRIGPFLQLRLAWTDRLYRVGPTRTNSPSSLDGVIERRGVA